MSRGLTFLININMFIAHVLQMLKQSYKVVNRYLVHFKLCPVSKDFYSMLGSCEYIALLVGFVIPYLYTITYIYTNIYTYIYIYVGMLNN